MLKSLFVEENLNETLFGGQTFSWAYKEGIYEAVLNGRVYRVKSFRDIEKDSFLSSYFDTDYDYESAEREIMKRDEILFSAVKANGRIRILKQDPWLTTVSFIISQNNNIKRITGLYRKISAEYGEEIEKGYYSFPSAERMRGVKEGELRALGLGFRSPYIIDAVNKAYILGEIGNLSFNEALEKLKEIRGIGDKVASCILIYAFQRREGFPLDVWMKRVMEKYYKGKDISYFHPYEALCQQYLFSWIRREKD